MVHFYENEGKKVVTAVIKDSKDDAKIQVIKRLGLSNEFIESEVGLGYVSCCDISPVLKLDTLEMPNTVSATVHVQEGDTYDRQVGRDAANDKVIKNFESSKKKALIRWQLAMLKQIKNVSPETFDEAFAKLK
jgi:hypothetical protein